MRLIKGQIYPIFICPVMKPVGKEPFQNWQITVLLLIVTDAHSIKIELVTTTSKQMEHRNKKSQRRIEQKTKHSSPEQKFFVYLTITLIMQIVIAILQIMKFILSQT